MDNKQNKTYADCYLYKKYPQYGAILLDAIMKSERIEKTAKEFEDVIYEVKRERVNNDLLKVLTSVNTQLIIPPAPLPKPFKVFCAKDALRDKNNVKVFIDATNIITYADGQYNTNAEVLISYLINAKVSMFYTLKPNYFTANSRLKESGATCFAKLFTYIVDYIGKISTVEYARDKCMYLASRYYLTNILMLDNETLIKDLSRKIAGITEMKENTYDFAATRGKDNPFADLKEFVKLIGETFKLDLTTDLIVEKWLYLFGQGTGFALEYFPAFSAMLTDAYSGAYINNQKTIDKICHQHMIEFAKVVIYEFSA